MTDYKAIWDGLTEAQKKVVKANYRTKDIEAIYKWITPEELVKLVKDGLIRFIGSEKYQLTNLGHRVYRAGLRQ